MPLEERPEPVAGPGQVVVAVRASGICGSDVHGFTGSTGRRRVGVVMGHEAAGVVVEVGPEVPWVREGSRVVLRSILPCGQLRSLSPRPAQSSASIGKVSGCTSTARTRSGSSVPGSWSRPFPDGLAFEDAALVEPLASRCMP